MQAVSSRSPPDVHDTCGACTVRCDCGVVGRGGGPWCVLLGSLGWELLDSAGSAGLGTGEPSTSRAYRYPTASKPGNGPRLPLWDLAVALTVKDGEWAMRIQRQG